LATRGGGRGVETLEGGSERVDGDHRGVAFAVMAGVFTAIACGSSDAHLNPAVTLGFAVRAGDLEGGAVYRSTNAWRCCWRGAGVVALFAALEGDARCCGEVGVFCTAPAIRSLIPNLISELWERSCSFL